MTVRVLALEQCRGRNSAQFALIAGGLAPVSGATQTESLNVMVTRVRCRLFASAKRVPRSGARGTGRDAAIKGDQAACRFTNASPSDSVGSEHP
ncbi:hypothetical protein C7I85_14695 [Mesorhizobium soli]|uniref:Uncharacterized protein n=1 Tax=Pseudaminobacter soli (ex Li et al. 2025) TaxID=1295366 RepID=A0A2P7SD24_9HYPH|nr:hypothetical protein C7I85_14695 [Mesorhizobium soli]